MKVIKWISDNESYGKDVSVGALGGFFELGMRGQKDYFNDSTKESKPYVEAIRESVLEKGLKLTGEDHQSSIEGVPLFEDGTIGSFSWRAWGDLMAAIWSEEEDKDYSYMDFYM